MNISDLIKELEKIKKKEGDIKVCVTSDHEYWGTLYHLVNKHYIEVTDHAQPDGPKSGKSERAVVLGRV